MKKFEYSDKIVIKDFEVKACHGVNQDEKINPQRFLISATVIEDMSEAAKLDDLAKTASYSAVKKVIDAYVKNNCFDLIETLGVRLAELILKKFDNLYSAEVTVKKPDAPMSGVFDYVAVDVLRQWHTAYISLGSNLGNRDAYLNFAVDSLKSDEKIKDVVESSRLRNQPYGGIADNEFLNSVVEIRTLYTPFELIKCLNAIETQGDRERLEHWGNRTIDLDILFFDDMVIATKSLCIPHYDLQNRIFVLKPLSELNGNIVHPLTHMRVLDMLKALEATANL